MPEPRRLPDDTHPVSVRLQVSDLARSRQWYTTTLGCRVLGSSPGQLRLGAEGDADTALITLEERPGTHPTPPHSRLGLYHFAILLPSRAALGALVRHLASLDTRVGSADHLVSEALYLTDPDGLGIEVYADRPRSAWTYSNGHVDMTVDPLDLRDLADAATGPWAGLPAGTTLGHMHLHVGDLDQAARFYQDALGFDEMARLRGALFLAAGGYHHHLGINVWAAGASPAGETDARLLEWTLHVPDAARASASAERFEAAGHTLARDAAGAWTVADPWGTRLRVVT